MQGANCVEITPEETYLDHEIDVFKGISPAWLEIIDKACSDGHTESANVRDILGKIPVYGSTPPPHLVFEMFRYCQPEDIKFVIIGQDPYPGVGVAQGLSFSCQEIAGSLKNIFACLEQSELLFTPQKTDPFESPDSDVRVTLKPVRGDLRTWAVQGGLLINTSLTTKVGVSNMHKGKWAGFTENIIRYLIESRLESERNILVQMQKQQAEINPNTEVTAMGNARTPIYFLAWGKDAESVVKGVRNIEEYGDLPGCHHVLTWRHPSPMANTNRTPSAENFINCDHFAKISKIYKTVWNNRQLYYAFTDGACEGNGKPHSRAGFGVYIRSNKFPAVKISGPVYPSEYSIIRSHTPKGAFLNLKKENIPVRPSNNRGEMIAIVYALIATFRMYPCNSRIFIVTDSKYCLGTLTEWFDAKKAKGLLDEVKNLDLIKCAKGMMHLHESILGNKIHFEYVKSHRAEPVDCGQKEKSYWMGNNIADKLATTSRSTGEFEVSSNISYIQKSFEEDFEIIKKSFASLGDFQFTFPDTTEDDGEPDESGDTGCTGRTDGTPGINGERTGTDDDVCAASESHDGTTCVEGHLQPSD